MPRNGRTAHGSPAIGGEAVRLEFKGWRGLRAETNTAGIIAFLTDTAQTAHRIFRTGSEASRGGRVYRRAGRDHTASAPGDWPARDTGRLLGSIRTVVTRSQAEIGTTARSDRGFPYPIVLRTGSRKRKIARRKMSDTALKEAVPLSRKRMQPFARFRFR